MRFLPCCGKHGSEAVVAIRGLIFEQVYLLTIWYKRYEVMHRMAIFYAAASLSGAFSGLLAYGIQHMEGIGGRHGWQWVSQILGASESDPEN